jgi:hypothetical protein
MLVTNRLAVPSSLLAVGCLEMSKENLPIACSLPARESRNQIGEWQALVEHQIATHRTNDGFEVVYDVDVSEVVEDLAQREAACCGFLDMAFTRTPDSVRLRVTSPNPDALPVIELLVGVQR